MSYKRETREETVSFCVKRLCAKDVLCFYILFYHVLCELRYCICVLSISAAVNICLLNLLITDYRISESELLFYSRIHFNLLVWIHSAL